ncbi:MAG: Crp/Fnr family transcriptional regulator [Polymorphobacter sp.]
METPVPTSPCADCAIRNQMLCAALDDTELLKLSQVGLKKRFSRGETIIHAGSVSPIFANIVSGVLKLARTTGDGREAIVGLLFPADFVGRLFGVRTDTDVTALTDVELCVYPRQNFEAALTDLAKLERQLLASTLDALDFTREWMVLLGRKSATERVASFLLVMAQRLKTPPGAVFDLPLTRAQIADVLGLTIETISRQITRLKTAGIIEVPAARSVRIVRPQALRDLAEVA